MELSHRDYRNVARLGYPLDVDAHRIDDGAAVVTVGGLGRREPDSVIEAAPAWPSGAQLDEERATIERLLAAASALFAAMECQDLVDLLRGI